MCGLHKMPDKYVSNDCIWTNLVDFATHLGLINFFINKQNILGCRGKNVD